MAMTGMSKGLIILLKYTYLVILRKKLFSEMLIMSLSVTYSKAAQTNNKHNIEITKALEHRAT